MYQLCKIGEIKKEGAVFMLHLKKEFKKGMKFAGLFSHMHVFYTEEEREGAILKERIMELIQIDKKYGIMQLQCESLEIEQACVFDLKPYIPCEDSVKVSSWINYDPDSIPRTPIDGWDTDSGKGGLQEIGKVRKAEGHTYIQLEPDYLLPCNLTCSHIKVIWWFHKFDDTIYRKCVECNPPYENAPRTGVFATRSPVRPNPIAMTITRILKYDIAEHRIYIQDIECFDKTPCLAVWPYALEMDLVRDVRVPFWMEQWPKWLNEESADTLKGRLDSYTLNVGEDSELYDQTYMEEWETMLEMEEQSESTAIHVRGARENNLKGIDCKIPYGKITAVVGVSGSGKSSLVQDTVYAECKRRMECLADQDSTMKNPDIDSMSGGIPAVMISQREIGKNSRSTVGTYSNGYEYLRMIYAMCATRYCPQCGEALGEGKLVCGKCERLLFELTPAAFQYSDPESMCLVCNGTGYRKKIDISGMIENPQISILDGASSWWGKLRSFIRNPNANWMKGEVIGLAQQMQIDLELPWCQLPEEFRHKILYGTGKQQVTFIYHNRKNGRNGEICRPVEGVYHTIERFCSEKSNMALEEKYIKKVTCECCEGERLNADGRLAAIGHMRYPRVAAMTFTDIAQWCRGIPGLLDQKRAESVKGFVQKLFHLSVYAEKLGIGHLELSRNTSTLSGGESQRLKLLTGMQNQLSGVLYVLDEPSRGLHPKDYGKIADMIAKLKQNGNTILMVEHNEDMIRIADQLIEIGPAAGAAGGYVTGAGSLEAILSNTKTQTGRYMKSGEPLCIYQKQKTDTLSWMTVHGARYNNLKNITVKLPLHAITCICGVSGSGKSSLVKGVLFPGIQSLIGHQGKPEFCEHIENADSFQNIVMVEQSAIGRTSRSVPATYIGIMDAIREVFAGSRNARAAGLAAAAFSFNGSSGQCVKCHGEGQIQPGFSQDIWVTCPVCKGKRYRRQVLDVFYQGKNIYEVLQMSVEEAVNFFRDTENIGSVLSILCEVGLGYLKLGQSSATLSGGEASRLKLAKELTGKSSDGTLYLIDEPTSGLHFSDIKNLLRLFQKLIDNGGTIVLIEHNKDVVNNCDWVIELGPGAGNEGGYVVSEGMEGSLR